MALTTVQKEENRRDIAAGLVPRHAESLTAADAGTVNSGDATTNDVIVANRTRIAEIAAKLVELGILS